MGNSVIPESIDQILGRHGSAKMLILLDYFTGILHEIRVDKGGIKGYDTKARRYLFRASWDQETRHNGKKQEHR